MKKILYGVFLLALAPTLACNKILDTEVQDFLAPENFYQTEADLNRAVVGVYDVLGRTELHASNMLGRMALDGDEAFYTGVQNTGVFVNDVNAADPDVYNYWRTCYEGINRANLVLANINKPKVDTALRNQARAEVRMLRAYYLLMLVSQFGGVPFTTTPTTDANATQLARTGHKDCYQFILREMDEAAQALPTATKLGFGGRLSRSAAWGICARVCLYMAGKPFNDPAMMAQARSYARRVMETNEHDLNPSFQQVFVNYAQDRYDVKESIWEVEFWGNAIDAYRETGRIGSNNGIRQTADFAAGTANGFIGITGRLFRSYAAGDLRRDWAIGPFRFSGNPAVKTNYTATQIYDRHCGKWRREFELLTPRTAQTPQNLPLLRYSDVLLMFAEAENEVNGGPSAAAYDAVNQVRRRAFGKPVRTPDPTVDVANLTQTSFRQYIQDERSRELCFELLRKRDLVRWGIFLSRMKLIAADFTTDAMTTALRARALTFNNTQERDEYWPIPERDLALNRLLTQNPGW